MSEPSAKSVLAWAVHITPNEWAKFMGDDRTDKSLATILRALRLLAACEEVDFRGIMDALRSDGWNNSSQVQRVLGAIAQILEGGEDDR